MTSLRSLFQSSPKFSRSLTQIAHAFSHIFSRHVTLDRARLSRMPARILPALTISSHSRHSLPQLVFARESRFFSTTITSVSPSHSFPRDPCGSLRFTRCQQVISPANLNGRHTLRTIHGVALRCRAPHDATHLLTALLLLRNWRAPCSWLAPQPRRETECME